MIDSKSINNDMNIETTKNQKKQKKDKKLAK